MWEIKILTVGKTRNKAITEEINRLLSHISDGWRLSFDNVSVAEKKDITARTKDETLFLLSRIPKNCIAYFLSTEGKEYDSENFSNILKKHKDSGEKICFVIGGAYGLEKTLLPKNGKLISLSKMTFSHEMALLVLVEQIYRAYTVYNNIPYAK
ncbi:MAG: 23S rRNA (pseudouridine(1915)-N(3))-methyltransferase RlmH [Thermoanaerobaculaceae bacterium]|nr:23S rRNA (pseudouridine(1915)-N(3))-methyltransferase RlmH [Thermoanaerobaculaceae bacterium]